VAPSREEILKNKRLSRADAKTLKRGQARQKTTLNQVVKFVRTRTIV
jgi:hypothetical protein